MKNKTIALTNHKEITDKLLDNGGFTQSIIELSNMGVSTYDVFEAVKSMCQTKLAGSKENLITLHKQYFDLALKTLKKFNSEVKQFIEADLFYTLGRKNPVSSGVPDEISDETYLNIVGKNILEGSSVYDTMYCASVIRPELTSEVVGAILKSTKSENMEQTQREIKQAFNRSYENTDTDKTSPIVESLFKHSINLTWSRRDKALEEKVKSVIDFNPNKKRSDFVNLMKESNNIYYILYSAIAYANKKDDFFSIADAIDASLDSGANPYFTLFTACRAMGKENAGMIERLITEYSRKNHKFGQVNEMMQEEAIINLFKNENIFTILRARKELKDVINDTLIR